MLHTKSDIMNANITMIPPGMFDDGEGGGGRDGNNGEGSHIG